MITVDNMPLESIERHLKQGRKLIHNGNAYNHFYQFKEITHEISYDEERPEQLRYLARCMAGSEKFQLWMKHDMSLEELLKEVPLDIRRFWFV